jgi:hypothetical protein
MDTQPMPYIRNVAFLPVARSQGHPAAVSVKSEPRISPLAIVRKLKQESAFSFGECMRRIYKTELLAVGNSFSLLS